VSRAAHAFLSSPGISSPVPARFDGRSKIISDTRSKRLLARGSLSYQHGWSLWFRTECIAVPMTLLHITTENTTTTTYMSKLCMSHLQTLSPRRGKAFRCRNATVSRTQNNARELICSLSRSVSSQVHGLCLWRCVAQFRMFWWLPAEFESLEETLSTSLAQCETSRNQASITRSASILLGEVSSLLSRRFTIDCG
jgi:hypothetical protein